MPVVRLSQLPSERQWTEFRFTLQEALTGIRFYQDYPEKEAWAQTLFPLFLDKWGNTPLADLPLDRFRHFEVIVWLRNQLDELRLSQTLTFYVEPLVPPGTTVVVEACLKDNTGQIADIVAQTVKRPSVHLWFDRRCLDPNHSLVEQHVVSHVPLQWSEWS